MDDEGGRPTSVELAYPDTLVGTDSHTTMVNGLAVLGWGVGGIEAEAAMLGQPLSMLLPEVIGFRLTGELREGVTATDLVLTVTQMLRKKGVVGKFVEFYGPGLDAMSVADRATIANMAPEYGATCGFFPIDVRDDPLSRDLGPQGRRASHWSRPTPRRKASSARDDADPVYTDTLALDLGDGHAVARRARSGRRTGSRSPTTKPASQRDGDRVQKRAPTSHRRYKVEGTNFDLGHGDVVIAAITSCTNTSNPSVMIAAGLLARNAVAKGLTVKPWVKTSLAPGSQVVEEYLEEPGCRKPSTSSASISSASAARPASAIPARCRGDLRDDQQAQSRRRRRPLRQSQFRGPRQSRHARELPRLAAARRRLCARRLDAGRPDNDPLGHDKDGEPVFLKRHLADERGGRRFRRRKITAEMFKTAICQRLRRRRQLAQGQGAGRPHLCLGHGLDLRAEPALFRGHEMQPRAGHRHRRRAHPRRYSSIPSPPTISRPAGSIREKSPAGEYLVEHQVRPIDFNQYGTRRGNHEVMMRGTFANIRIKNQMVRHGNVEGGYTMHQPSGERMPIYDAAMRYQTEACRSSSSPARNTAQAPRATGRPRARSCSACAR